MARSQRKKIFIFTRINEYPGVFREDNGIMFYNYCELSVDWKTKSTVDGHFNSLLPFFKKYPKEGGAIPQASTLRQIYLPQVFENHFSSLKNYFNQKPVAIIMDETTDDCSRSVVNTLFSLRQNTKLISVNFLDRVNNSTMGGTLLSILSNYNIPYTLLKLSTVRFGPVWQ
ncbi:hypothetical protein Glove_48g182 [Diversispora epigaea]|uniref:DUF659 domain-containing protein n=1 Tax=Diversispora epigaea TaxID=1348612 RepID=A0A397JP32_9GLOM|nr:hypothetical protein Glove_48g185 [Diversispora epigaea]RHZ86664.1 hypothetical protein Glove_48g182 [Diversispora epigaea]